MSCLNLIGKDSVFDNILAAYRSKMLSHAILIEGDRGVGKKTLAKAVCKLIMCQGNGAPCDSCSACIKIEKQIHPDIFEVTPSGKSNTIGVKEIEAIKHNIFIKPNDSDYKIFIIQDAERMNVNAQNAMLKMIEEPVDDTFFIFTSKNSHALLPTVLSRVTVYRVSPAQNEEVMKELVRRFPEKSESELKEAAQLSCGNIGVAVELAKGEGREIYTDAVKVLKSLVSSDRALLCVNLGRYSKKKAEAIELVELIKLAFRDICANKSGADNSYSGIMSQIEEVSSKISSKAALLCMSACDEFVAAVNQNANLPLAITALEIKLVKAIYG